MIRVPSIAILAVACVLRARQPSDSPAFEAASVKASEPTPTGNYSGWMRGGPGSQTPTRLDYHNANMTGLVGKAYGVATYLVVGPEWLNSEKYDIEARVAAGATPEQFKTMMQNLLAERFKMQTHREKREIPVYSLTVLKTGSTLKEHVEVPAAPAGDKPSRETKLDEDGYPVVNGRGFSVANGRAHLQMTNDPVSGIIGVLTPNLGAPVIDRTGLTGKYDYSLKWSLRQLDANGEPDNAPDIFAALEIQLGLKLEKRREPMEVIVVDHAEKTPSEN